MENRKKTQHFALVALSIILFLSISLSFILARRMVVFDTLREYGAYYNFINKGNASLVLDWYFYLSNGVHSTLSGLDPYYTFLYGGILITLISTIFFHLICREIIANKNLNIAFTALFAIGTTTISSFFYYRPQTIALLFFLALTYIFLKAIKRKEYLNYLVISFIITLISLNIHKTTKIFPFLFATFWIYHLIKFRHGKLKIILLIAFLAFLVAFSYPILDTFFEFYLNIGHQIDPSAFDNPGVTLFDFFKSFGYFIIPLFIAIITSLIGQRDWAYTKSAFQDSNIIVYTFFMLFFSISYILPALGIFSVNSGRLDFFLYPYLLLTIAIFLNLLIKSKSISLKVAILILVCCFVIYASPDISESKKYTADYKYLNEVKGLPLGEGDVVITSFTSTAALQAGLDSNANYSRYDVSFISGYYSWGTNSQAISRIREIASSDSESYVEEQTCLLIKNESSLIASLPVFPEFLTPSIEEKKKILSNLDSPKRIIFLFPRYDSYLRENRISQDDNVASWWQYRTFNKDYYIGFSKLKNFKEIYSSDKVIMFESQFEC